MITSRSNPRIKALAALQQGRPRRETGLTLVEGVRPVREALLYAEVRTLIVSEQWKTGPETPEFIGMARDRKAEVITVTDDCYRKISGLRHPEGIAVVIAPPRLTLDTLLRGEPRLIAGFGLQDPGNAGAIVRVAEAAGSTGCLFLGGVDVTHPRFLRTAMGSAFRLPCAAAEIGGFLDECRGRSVRIIAATADSEAVPFSDVDFTPPLAICIGGEGAGLPEGVEAAADILLTIPMSGQAESLNAAVAAGIILYAARRQWLS